MAYIMAMWINPITVVETLTFQRQADDVWSADEREAFVDFIARNPEAGDVIREGGWVRKVRWAGEAQENAGVLRSSIFLQPRHAALPAAGLCEGGTHGHFARREKGSERIRRAH